MTRTIFIIGIIFLASSAAWGQHATKEQRHKMRSLLRAARKENQTGKATETQDFFFNLKGGPANAINDAKNLLDSLRQDMVQRKYTYAFTSGYHCAAGSFSLQLDDRLLFLSPQLQPGISLGFSPITGAHGSMGLSYFFTGENKIWMPLMNAQLSYASGNALASHIKDSGIYCTTSKGTYLSIGAGVKVKPWQVKTGNPTPKQRFGELISVKIFAGYSIVLQQPKVDSVRLPSRLGF